MLTNRSFPQELRGRGIAVDAQTFDETLIAIFHKAFPGMSVDTLLCRPKDNGAVCAAMREAFQLDESCEELIVRRLGRLRRTGQLKSVIHHTAITETTIQATGYTEGKRVWTEEIERLFLADYKGRTVEWVLNRWRESLRFAQIAAERLGVRYSDNAGQQILGTLLARRKQGFLSVGSSKE